MERRRRRSRCKRHIDRTPERGIRSFSWPRRRRVSRYIENCVDPPSHNAVDKAIKGNTDARRIAIDTLISEGYIATEEGPRKAILLRCIKAYREADDTTSPTSPDFSSTSPKGEDDDFSHLSPTPVGGGSVGEVEVSQDEIERLSVLAETAIEEAQ